MRPTRTLITQSNSLAFGCSHTYGTANKEENTWPYLLGAINFGKPGGSIDYIARIFLDCVNHYKPHTVYILWPNFLRFEYKEYDQYLQSLPTDPNRYKFLLTHNEEWCQKNYYSKVEYIKTICKQKHIKLIDMELDDLAPYIDYPDRWPLASDQSHYNHEWHRWVADIYKKLSNEQT